MYTMLKTWPDLAFTISMLLNIALIQPLSMQLQQNEPYGIYEKRSTLVLPLEVRKTEQLLKLELELVLLLLIESLDLWIQTRLRT
jgi:hypothetical protein